MRVVHFARKANIEATEVSDSDTVLNRATGGGGAQPGKRSAGVSPTTWRSGGDLPLRSAWSLATWPYG